MGSSHSYYHSQWASSPKSLQNLARKVAKVIRTSDVQFDAIACRGVSGIVVASAVASRLAKQLIVVRKPDVKSHSDVTAEGRPLTDYTYIIIDDLVCTGKTIRETMKVLMSDEKYRSHGYGHCTGVFLYNDFVYGIRKDGWCSQCEVRCWEEKVQMEIEYNK
jgi:orotate phosphoribosyltransferase